jgi:hypothetical protein
MINSPITSSLLAEIEAICLILSESVPTTLDCFAVRYNRLNSFVNTTFQIQD